MLEGETPCIHAGDSATKGYQTFYPLENDRLKASCEYDDFLETFSDSRYIDTGGRTTEWDLQNDSGALEAITELPLFTQYNPEYESQKKNNLYKFWTRPTITWNLECEENVSR